MGVSFSQFARLMEVSPQAVGKARRSGRLRESVGVDDRGRPCIADVEVARREWRDNAGRLSGTTRRRASPLAPDPDPGVSVFRLGGRVALAWGDDLHNLDSTQVLHFDPSAAVNVARALLAKAGQEADDDVQ